MIARRLHLVALAAALLAGCAAPAIAPSAPAPDGPAAAPTYRLMAGDEPLDVVVRYRDGAAAKRPGRGRQKRALRLAGTRVLSVATLAEREALLAELAASPDVLWAEPDYRAHALAGPTDPRAGEMWGLAKVGAPTAWALGPAGRGAGVTVAVVDTGIDGTHEDLEGQVVGGYDVINQDEDPMDDEGHGTHVAGTVAASQGNAYGGVGVAPEADLLAYKVLDQDGSGGWSEVADGIVRAVDDGADVINLSLGGTYDASVVRDAVAYAVAQDVVVVAAAGNEKTSRKSYPAAYPGVLAVGAVGPTDARASFSNYGAWVNLAAPGVGILSSVPGDAYDNWNGTSMASPHVAGAAAVLRALRPDWSRTQVFEALVATGAPAKGFTGAPALRRIDLGKAATLASDVVAPTLTSVAVSKISRSGATVTIRTNEQTGASVAYGKTAALGTVKASSGVLATSRTIVLSGLARATTYHYQVTATDAGRNAATSAIATFRTSN